MLAQIFPHDTPAHDDAPPNHFLASKGGAIQKLSSRQNPDTRTEGQMETRADGQSTSRIPPLPVNFVRVEGGWVLFFCLICVI